MRKFLFALIGLSACIMSPAKSEQLAIDQIDVILRPAASPSMWSDGKIVITVQNRGTSDVFLPKVSTPLFTPEGHLMTNVLTVEDENGAKARFIGRFVHVLPRSPSTFYERVKPSTGISSEIDITADYAVQPGRKYKVSYEQAYTASYSEDERGELSDDGLHVKSNVIEITMSPSLKGAQARLATDNDELVCSAAQRQSVDSVRWTADTWRRNASNKLEGLFYVESQKNPAGQSIYYGRISSDTSYDFWFGQPTRTAMSYLSKPRITDYWKTTQDFLMFRSLNLVFSNIGFAYACGCPSTYPESTAAWTQTSPTNLIHLCDRFFRLPDTDGPYDSKVLTLIHEISHFPDSEGGETADYAYGRSASHTLTLTDREKAVKNADNLMYYVGSANQ